MFLVDRTSSRAQSGLHPAAEAEAPQHLVPAALPLAGAARSGQRDFLDGAACFRPIGSNQSKVAQFVLDKKLDRFCPKQKNH